MRPTDIIIAPLTTAEVEEILAWRYAPPYDLYDILAEDEEGIESQRVYFLAPTSRCYALRNADGTFLGYGSLGEDAQVPGGDYSVPALDLGIGIRPDLTGQGKGKRFLAALVAFARTQEPTIPALRVTVAVFNERAQRLVRGGGFRQTQQFARPSDGLKFRVFILL